VRALGHFIIYNALYTYAGIQRETQARVYRLAALAENSARKAKLESIGVCAQLYALYKQNTELPIRY